MYVPPLPPGRPVELPGRGSPWVWDTGRPNDPSDAPTLVLLHGWGSTAALNWRPSFGPLSQEFRVVAVDHRGHGRGIRTWRPFRLEDCADDVAALIDELDIAPAVVVGYSMGGPIAQLVWRRHRDAVAGLVLCATAARFSVNPQLVPAVGAFGLGLSIALSAVPDPVWRQMRARALRNRAIDDPRLVDWVLDEQRHSDAASLVQAATALNAYDAWDWIHTVDVPTSVVVTEADQTVSPTRQHRLADAVPHAVAFPVNGDHRVCVDSPRRFVPALLDACRHAAGITAAPTVADPPAPTAATGAR